MEHVEGLTQTLTSNGAEHYGGTHFVCETIMHTAAKIIVEALGGELVEGGE
jgi:hypothetical protein